MDYKKYDLGELVSKKFREEPVEIKGIIRGTNVNGEIIWGCIQSETNLFVRFKGKYLSQSLLGSALALLKTSSESGIEVSAKGIYNTRAGDGWSGDLYLHRVDLGNTSVHFLIK